MYTFHCRKIIKEPNKKLSYKELQEILYKAFNEIEQEGLYENEYKLISRFTEKIDDYILKALK